MLGIINSAILLSQAMNSRPRTIMDPEGYRVARVTGDYLAASKARALAAEAELDALQDEHAELMSDVADLEEIVARLSDVGTSASGRTDAD
ncbi:hypothetical protein T8T21_17370 (plasmid) [Limimaricola variabilis]|uniref:hypothetical protein n=1 Tax=Limimaricola variabilis TaxID=1492771 RepID=UPI002AC9BDCB|nr:hypothetical protein [Limimaricola variabilis]WPY96523.1 hypothetical protein T8T21_17370 [Limimaricola variabilis]